MVVIFIMIMKEDNTELFLNVKPLAYRAFPIILSSMAIGVL